MVSNSYGLAANSFVVDLSNTDFSTKCNLLG